MNLLEKYDVIIFDCDGVLIDSNKKKSDAFTEVIKEYPNNFIEEFITYHKNNGGVSRYKKFEHFILKILKQEFNENLYNNLITDYSNLCKQIYKTSDFTIGAIDLLKKLSISKDLFIASGSDEEELKESFISKGSSEYFVNIFGSPKRKDDIVTTIKNRYEGKNLVLIGDSYKDYEAAFNNNIDFIYMNQYSEQSTELKKLSQANATFTINTLQDILIRRAESHV
jgi:phosphoglycolate phosphatase-like HAD superfamily hydrolase